MLFLKKAFQYFTGLVLILVSHMAMADYQLNMTPGVTPVSHDVYRLHMAAFWICVGIGVVVFGIMFYSIIMHRKSRHPTPAKFYQHLGLEITWAVIPFLILVIIAIPATVVLFRMNDTRNSDVVIKITGYQWKWRYEYLNQGIGFYSNLSTPMDQRMNYAPKDKYYLLEVDNPMVVPVGEKIRFLVTANDVIHSWWVPDLGIKQDAIPGFIHEAWATIDTPGVYRGQCAELCGAGHAFMPIVVNAVSKEDFAKWVQQMSHHKVNINSTMTAKAWTKSELLQKGRQVFHENCARCHQDGGEGIKSLYPSLKGSVKVNGPINEEVNIVLHGVPGTQMQGFKDQLSPEEIAAVVAYTRSSWNNTAGDIIQPADVNHMK